jgi:hypothetical protein
MTPLFNIITSFGTDNYNWTFDIAEPDLSSALEGMFDNVTLALIAARKDTANVDVTFLYGNTMYGYRERYTHPP